MAREMQSALLERMHRTKARLAGQPQELQELDARIARLRNRLAAGDPDMTPDEIEAAIDRAERKRRELIELQPIEATAGAKLLTILPNAAELYRRQISLGLDRASPEVTLKARQALRELLGDLRLEPDGQGGLWAAYEVQLAVLIRGAVTSGAG